jgi:hypothetical protein
MSTLLLRSLAMQHALVQPPDEAAYLEVERTSGVKHEYVAGEVFAMAGASKAHGTLALNPDLSLGRPGSSVGVWVGKMASTPLRLPGLR